MIHPRDILPRQQVLFPFAKLRRALGRVPPSQWGTPGHPALPSFERAFASALSLGHAIALGGGRQALGLILEALQLPAGADIAMPAFTFHALPGVVLGLGFTPHFVDVCPETFNVQPEATHQLAIGWARIGTAMGYGFAYTAVVLAAAVLVFHQRDFK